MYYVNMYVLDVDSNEAQVVIGDDDDGDQVGVHIYIHMNYSLISIHFKCTCMYVCMYAFMNRRYVEPRG